MKRCCLIGAFLFLMLAGCQIPEETRHGMSLPSELVAIDTLMQTRPDSALTLLWASPMDDPYYQLLLSEALYKNDSTQLNRPELLKALAYFDSVACPFLSARCHYMNGVGYYEMDSVVQACEQYLKALEIMEEHYEEKDLVGYKAKFMALVYTHLCNLFSDQYLHEQAVFFGKRSLVYYYKHDAEPWHLAWILDVIGAHYDMLGTYDSADYYYHKALETLADTNNLSYRISSGHLAFLTYKETNDEKTALVQLYRLLDLSESDREYFSGCLSIGEIYYVEKMYDSAWKYLSMVFNESPSIDSRKQAAEWLVEICQVQNKDESSYFANFLVPFANENENKSTLKSLLSKQYNDYIHLQQEKHYQKYTHYRLRRIGITIGGLLVITTALAFRYFANKRKKKRLEKQIIEERHAHEAKQKAMGGRLKKSNEALRIQRNDNKRLLQELETQQNHIQWSNLDTFMNEAICHEILESLKDKNIKRAAKSEDYSELRLYDTQLSQLLSAVEQHFHGFSKVLTDRYPRISDDEIHQCVLCLLNLKDVQIATLLHCDYSTIKKRSSKLKKAFCTEKSLQAFIREYVS